MEQPIGEALRSRRARGMNVVIPMIACFNPVRFRIVHGDLRSEGLTSGLSPTALSAAYPASSPLKKPCDCRSRREEALTSSEVWIEMVSLVVSCFFNGLLAALLTRSARMQPFQLPGGECT